MTEQTTGQTKDKKAGRWYAMISGGKGSWAAVRYLIDVHQIDPSGITGIFTDTNAEDADLYRFLDESTANLGINLVRLDNDGMTPWDAFRKARMIGNTRLSVCSRMLKQKPAHDWLAANAHPTAEVIVGIDWTESHRLPAIERNYAPRGVIAPLTWGGAWSRERVDKELAAAGIEPPRLYAQGFPHNNCGGACVRGGQGQWALLLRTNPERYAAEEMQENAFREEVGKDVSILRDRRGGTTKPLTLTALRERVMADEVDMLDLGGCGCFLTYDNTTPEADR